MNTLPESLLDVDRELDLALRVDGGTLAALTAFDRCDAGDCTAQAYLRVQLPSGGQLVFCGHHGHELTPALAARGAVVRDDTHLLRTDR